MAAPNRSDNPFIFWTLVAVVCVAPLLSGSMVSWSWAPLAGVVGVLLALWTGSVALGRQDAVVGLRQTWFLVAPFAAVAIWICLQATSVTPERWHHPLWASAAESLGETIASSISLNPHLTLSHLARLLMYGAVFWLALQYGRKTIRARQVLWASGGAGFVYAVLGLVLLAIARWFPPGTDSGTPLDEGLRSTLISADAFASYAGLCLICLTALVQITLGQRSNAAVSQLERDAIESGAGGRAPQAMRPRRWSLAMVRRLIAGLTAGDLWLFVAWFTVLGALLATGSRPGIVAGLTAVIALIVVFGLSRSTGRNQAASVAVIILLALGLGFAFAGSFIESWLLAGTDIEERSRLHRLVLDAISSAPIVGSGFGSFEEVFRFYRASDIKGYYVSAQSTFLESVLELGLPAAAIWFAMFVGLLVLCVGGIRGRHRDGIYPCVGFAATILIGVQSFVGSSAQVPAIAASYALVMGIACAQSWSARETRIGW